MSSPVPLSPGQFQVLLAQVLAQLGPPAAGEGFPNPVAALFQAGYTVVINSSGLFVYAGQPALGNLLMAVAVTGGADPYGNPVVAGLNATQGQLTGVNINQSTLTAVQLLAATLTSPAVNAPVIAGGTATEIAITFDSAGGRLLIYGSTTTTAVINPGTTTWTAPAGTYTNGKVETWGPDAGGGGGNSSEGGEAGGGGAYSCEPNYPMLPGDVFGVSIGGPGTGGTTGYAGQSGTTATQFDTGGLRGTGVAAFAGQAGASFSGGLGGAANPSQTISYHGGRGGSGASGATASAGGGGRAGSAGPGGNGTAASGTTPGVGGAAGAGVGGLAGNNGAAPSTNGSTGLAGGSGAGAAAATAQGQRQYRLSASASYYGSDAAGGNANGQRNTGTMYQGGETDQGGVYNGTQCSMGILAGNPASDLSGVTIDQVSLRLNNLHSWYNTIAVLLGYHADTALPGSWNGGGTTQLGTWWMSEGATGPAFDLTSTGLGAALKSGAARALTLGYNGQPAYNLYNYGFFYGAGGDSNYNPLLTVNYHTGTAPKVAGSGSGGVIRVTYSSAQTLLGSVAAVAGTDGVTAYPAVFGRAEGSQMTQLRGAQTSVALFTVVAASAAQLTAAYTIPAGDPAVATTWRLTAYGHGTQGSTLQNWNFWLRLNGAQPGPGQTGLSSALGVASTLFHWRLVCEIQCTGTGAGGSISYGYTVTVSTAQVTTSANAGTAACDATGQAFNTTIDNTVGLAFSWGSTTGAPTITCEGSSFERLGP